MRTVLLLLFAGCNGSSKGDCAHPGTWYPDSDGDGFGAEPGEQACSPPNGHVDRSGDCDDGDPEVHFGVAESCNGVDDDCDGVVDPDDALDAAPCFTDRDGDGYGTDLSVDAACDCPDGTAHGSDDCDDYDAGIHPGAEESWYDGIDADCLGDDDDDADGDGSPGGGWDATDCDDDDPAIHPDAEEICANGIDENCDGAAPECGVGGTMTPDHAETRIESHVPSYLAQDVQFSGDNDGDGVPEVITAVCNLRAETEEEAQIQYRVYNVPRGRVVDADTEAVAVFEPPGFLYDWGNRSAGCSDWPQLATDTDMDGDGYTDFLLASPTAGTLPSRFDLWYGPATGTIDLDEADTVVGDASYPYFGQLVELVEADGAGAFSVAMLNNTALDPETGNAAAIVLTDEHFLGEATLADAAIISTPTGWGIGPGLDAGDADGDGVSDLLVITVPAETPRHEVSFAVLLGPFDVDRSTSEAALTVGVQTVGEMLCHTAGFEQDSASGYPRLAVACGTEDCSEGVGCGAIFVHEYEEGGTICGTTSPSPWSGRRSRGRVTAWRW